MNAVSFALHLPDSERADYLQKCLPKSIASARRTYPEATIILHHDSTVPKEFLLLADVTQRWPLALDVSCMFWRFATVGSSDYDAVLVRDADSICGAREGAAVADWLESGLGFHTMHDHIAHTARVMGGMWGARRDAFPYDFQHLVRWWIKHKGPFDYDADQWFLSRYVWPYAERNGIHHCDGNSRFVEQSPFPPYHPMSDEPQHVGAYI